MTPDYRYESGYEQDVVIAALEILVDEVERLLAEQAALN